MNQEKEIDGIGKKIFEVLKIFEKENPMDFYIMFESEDKLKEILFPNENNVNCVICKKV